MLTSEGNSSGRHQVVKRLEEKFREKHLPTSGITRVVERTLKVVGNRERLDALSRIFGPQINTFTQEGALPAENIMLDLFDHIFDQGTNRDTECHVRRPDGSIHIISEPAVPIHSRSSFITALQYGVAKKEDIAIGMLDLARFRDADFSTFDAPPQSVRSADVVANKTARAIRNALKDVWEKLNFSFENDSFEVGRYGGDEFVIALTGKNAILQRNLIMKAVREKIEQQKGFYRGADGTIDLESIQLKKVNKEGDVIEWMSPPDKDNHEARRIYLDYLGRGLLLNEEEFARVLDKYRQNGVIDMARYQLDYEKVEAKYTIYPPGIIHINDRIEHLIDEHPEFGVFFRYLDTLNSDPGMQLQNKENLISIIENSIFDRLLGDFIYSRSHFAEHIRNGEIDRVHVVDFKFLKEINTDMTYADSDKELKLVWKKIKESIPPEQRKNIIVSRFAGAFYIGVKKGKSLDTDMLKNITSHTLFEDESPIKVPLGTTSRRIRPHERQNANKLLTSIEDNSDSAYYLRLFEDIAQIQNEDPLFIERMHSVDIQSLSHRGYAPLQKHELYAHMLRGKRSEARLTKLIDAFQHEREVRVRRILENSLRYLATYHKGQKTVSQKSEYIKAQIAKVNSLFASLVSMVRSPLE